MLGCTGVGVATPLPVDVLTVLDGFIVVDGAGVTVGFGVGVLPIKPTQT
jgi:hypothetical protein